MSRLGNSAQDAFRNERVDELSGATGHQARRAVRFEDLQDPTRLDGLLSALKEVGIEPPVSPMFSGGTMFLRPDAGAYLANGATGALSTIAPGGGAENIAPWLCPWDLSVDQLGLSCSTAVAATTCKITVYASDSLGRPASCLGETATIDTATTGTKFTAAAVTFKKGKLYWLGVRFSSTQTVRALAAGSCHSLAWTSAATPVQCPKLSRTLAYATPATAWVFANSQIVAALPPLVLMRVA